VPRMISVMRPPSSQPASQQQKQFGTRLAAAAAPQGRTHNLPLFSTHASNVLQDKAQRGRVYREHSSKRLDSDAQHRSTRLGPGAQQNCFNTHAMPQTHT
jgi:hypothetical protein